MTHTYDGIDRKTAGLRSSLGSMPQRESSSSDILYRQHIGRQIAAKRKEAGITQAELGRRVGRSRGTVWCWEHPDDPVRKATAPNAAVLRKIASALGCDVDDLTGGRESHEETPLAMAVGRLRKRAGVWRVDEFSRLPAEKIKSTIDAALSEHKDSQERRIQGED